MKEFPVAECPACPELDAAVAHALGWTLDPEGCWLNRKANYEDTGFGNRDNTYNFEIWCPSTNLAQAMNLVPLIVDRLNKTGESFGPTTTALAICRVFLQLNNVSTVTVYIPDEAEL